MRLARAARWSWLLLLACAPPEATPPRTTSDAESKATIEPQARPLPSLDAALLRRHTAALSDDAMQGRRPGTEGGARAVAYIQAELQALGLEPAGERGGWTQAVPMRAVSLDAAATQLSLHAAEGSPEALLLGDEIVVSRRGPAGTVELDAPLLFLGYGITAPEHGWDDYRDVDPSGAIVVVLIGEPPLPDDRFDGPALTYYGRWTYKLERAREAGALGCLVIHETAPASYGWNVVQGSWAGERFELREADDAAAALRVEGFVHESLAQRLAALDGTELAGWHALALRPDFTPRRLPATLRGRVVTTARELADFNVLGRIPGRTRPDEHLILSAHWDHLGIDPHAAPGQDAIFNGAVDNASGVAAVLGIAAGLQARAREGRGPARSVIVLATTAEEQGLLGSEHYAAHPLVPRPSIVAATNLDSMNVRGRTTTVAVPGSASNPLRPYLEDVARAQGRTIVGDERPEAGTDFRSDHFSFARRGIPAITFRGGRALEQGGPAAGEALAREAALRYHTVDDELDPSWSFLGAQQDAEAMLELLLRLGEADPPPASSRR